MFVRAIPNFEINWDQQYSFVASRKRPVLYFNRGNNDTNGIYEISLISGECQKIIDLPTCWETSLACDVNDNLYARLWTPINTLFYRFNQYRNNIWDFKLLTGYKDCGEAQYTFRAFSSMMNTSNAESYAYIKNDHFHYYDGTHWKDYKIIGDIGPLGIPKWILPYRQEGFLVYFHMNILGVGEGESKLWIARDGKMTKLCENGYEEPGRLTYSSITDAIYGLKMHNGMLAVFVYHFEVLSLFNQCIRVIRRHPSLREKVPPHLQEKVDNPETERFLRQKELVKNISEEELRCKYCII